MSWLYGVNAVSAHDNNDTGVHFMRLQKIIQSPCTKLVAGVMKYVCLQHVNMPW